MNTAEENRAKEILECFDLFGTKMGFYADGKPKFYTSLGGILSILSILISILSLFYFSLDDLKRTSPITTFSYIPSEGYRRIKFNEEKIWIPVRITDYYYNYINHKELIYPDMQYYYVAKNKNNDFEIKVKKLSYKLCNETSMINKPDIYSISVPLNQLYCINADDLEIGGFWGLEFLSFLTIDMYLCKNFENYSENNPNCTTYKKIREKIGYKNSLKFDIYYPTIQFQPLNYSNPIIILYRHYFYHISKYSNKIARLFLQEHVLSDDRGWIRNHIINNSYWGFSSLNWDDYATSETKDLINQGSTSRFFSLNIYLEPGIILYKRRYNKLLSIFIQGLPIMYIVFIIFENVSKLFKTAQKNKIMIELLFENLKETTNKFEKHLNIIKNSSKELDYSRSNLLLQSLKNIPRENAISNISLNISPKNKSDVSKKEEKQIPFTVNAFNFKNRKNKKGSSKLVIKKNFLSSNNLNYSIFNQNNIPIKLKYIEKKLFPKKFYFFSSFIKNNNIKKDNCFFSDKFAKVYTFLTQIIDISTYLVLIREFNILKTEFMDDKKRNYIEKHYKINVGANNFINDINQSLSSKNFHIFSRKKNFKK